MKTVNPNVEMEEEKIDVFVNNVNFGDIVYTCNGLGKVYGIVKHDDHTELHCYYHYEGKDYKNNITIIKQPHSITIGLCVYFANRIA